MALIYVVEDDKNISEIESFALKNAGHQIVECACAKEFHKQVQERIPDMVLLDIMLPDEDGLSILKKLRATPETRRIPVILVTAKTTEIDKVKGLDSGADDYLTKPFGVMELISRVKALLRRRNVYDKAAQEEKSNLPEWLGKGDIRICTIQNSVCVRGEEVTLTELEYRLLLLFMEYPQKIFSARNLYESAWEEPFDLDSANTVMVHIRRLRKKVEEDAQNPKLIETVWGKGYRLGR